ncbi:rCG63120 [Rattus norvegicus]|uniref:RCG63120 n=1 Tax=Rattus norvegicus TaxID=10116 RepID=A6K523_RAT|nr:rCG63120 [Rattus norvegicus]
MDKNVDLQTKEQLLIIIIISWTLLLLLVIILLIKVCVGLFFSFRGSQIPTCFL